MGFELRKATKQDTDALAVLAVLTFPLACPPGHTAENIAEHLRRVFSFEKFVEYASSPDFDLTVATDQGTVVGFTLIDYRPSADPDVQKHLANSRPYAELSKLYVHPDYHGAGIGLHLLERAIRDMGHREIHTAWLTVNQLNDRANAFYEKSSFTVIAAKKYLVGVVVDDDYLRVRVLGHKS